MNIFGPILIALAASAPVVVLMVWLHLKVERAPSRDAARLKVLRVLLWCTSGLVLLYGIWSVFANGARSSIVLPGCMLLLVLSNVVYQYCECKRRLKRNEGR